MPRTGLQIDTPPGVEEVGVGKLSTQVLDSRAALEGFESGLLAPLIERGNLTQRRLLPGSGNRRAEISKGGIAAVPYR